MRRIFAPTRGGREPPAPVKITGSVAAHLNRGRGMVRLIASFPWPSLSIEGFACGLAMRREDGDDPPTPEDLVRFDTAPAIEEKRQYPRAINIAVVPSGVAARSQRLDDPTTDSVQEKSPIWRDFDFPSEARGTRSAPPGARCELDSGSYVSPTSLRG